MKDIFLEFLAIGAFVALIMAISGGFHCQVNDEHYHLQLFESDEHGVEVEVEIEKEENHESTESTS